MSLSLNNTPPGFHVDLETYTYGADRQKLSMYDGLDTYYYFWGNGSIMAEYLDRGSPGPRWTKSYFYAGSRLIFTTSRVNSTTEKKETHHPDRLGTKIVTNVDSGAAFEQSTLPFGTAFGAESSGYSNQVFTSYDRSSTTGLDYANNRTYSSGQGRFTQVDPIGMSAASIGNPQSNNMYAYVQNMPTDFVDPSGLNMQNPGAGGQTGWLTRIWQIRDGSVVGYWEHFFPYPGQEDGGSFGASTNPQDRKIGQKCKDFVKWLVDKYWFAGTNAGAGTYLLKQGYDMMHSYALPKVRGDGGSASGGFRDELINAGQGGDAYAHFLVFAGLKLIAIGGGGIPVELADLGLKWLDKTDVNNPQHQTELRDDQAGTAIGQALHDGWKAGHNAATVRGTIENILCDPNK